MKRSLRLLPLAMALMAASAMAEEAFRVEGEVYRAELDAKAHVPERWASDGPMRGQVEAQLRLLALPEARIEALKRANARSESKMLQIGIERDLGSEIESWEPSDLTWVQVPGGWKARIDVNVPGAEALRVAVAVDHLPDGAWLRYQGIDDAQRDGADVERMRDLLDERGRFWTATTSGQTQRLEWFVPGGSDDAPKWMPQIIGVSHLFVDPHDPDFSSKALGDSGTCNIDVACRLGQLGQGFADVREAVAHMSFQSGGGSYICTGTLLNDRNPNTSRKWFYTAHHCIGSQAVASTLETYWNYEAPRCGGNSRGPNQRMTGGARHVYSSNSTDAALLELKGSLPGNQFYSGWDSAGLRANEAVVAVHHPRGDNKKVSFGTYLRPQAGVAIGGHAMDSAWRVTWREGTTEKGSSGSGLFTRNAAGKYYLRGGLAGGGASCSNSGRPESEGNYDYYSRFDQVFPAIRQYLYDDTGGGGGGGGGGGATRDYTGQWVAAGQNRRGLSMFRLSNGGLFILWFRYDSQNRPVWYQLEDRWTANDRLAGRFARFSGNANAPSWTGSYTLVFNSASSATFTYDNVDGDSGSITLSKAAL